MADEHRESSDPKVFATALDILKLLEVSLPTTPNGKHGKAATALIAALMAIYVEDFGQEQMGFVAMLAVVATRKLKSKGEIAELAKGADEHVRFE